MWCVVYLSVQVCLPSKAHVEARSWLQVVFLNHCFTLNFEVGSRHWTWSMPLWLGWLVSARVLLCLAGARTVDVQRHAEVAHSCLWLQLQCIGCIWPPWAPALTCPNLHVHIIQKNKSKSLKNIQSLGWRDGSAWKCLLLFQRTHSWEVLFYSTHSKGLAGVYNSNSWEISSPLLVSVGIAHIHPQINK